jgi:hypothetical protein
VKVTYVYEPDDIKYGATFGKKGLGLSYMYMVGYVYIDGQRRVTLNNLADGFITIWDNLVGKPGVDSDIAQILEWLNSDGAYEPVTHQLSGQD